MAEARPRSNAENQTDYTDDYPPLNERAVRKQTRTTEKRRYTKLTRRIENLMDNIGSRTELTFLRRELTDQLEVCIAAHNHYCTLFDRQNRPNDEWVTDLENTSHQWYGRIDEYIRTAPRAPSTRASTVSSNTVSIPGGLFHSPTNLTASTRQLSVPESIPESRVNQTRSRRSSSALSNTTEIRNWFKRFEDMERQWNSIGNIQNVVRETVEKAINNKQHTDANVNISSAPPAASTNSYDQILQQKITELEMDKKNRIAAETALRADLEKHKREIEEEKMARKADQYKLERESEEKMRRLLASYDQDRNLLSTRTNAFGWPTSSNKNPIETGAIPKASRGLLDFELEISNKNKPVDSISTKQKLPQCSKQQTNSNQWTINQNVEHGNMNPIGFPNQKSVFRIPKVDLKPFDGNPKNWPDFIAIYRDLVHNDQSISTTQKMAILKHCLTPEIRDGLGDSLSSPALYLQAISELESTYGHPQIVSRSYIQSLVQMPTVKTNDFKALMKVLQTINGSVASLKNGGYDHELQSTTLLELILSKLPPEIQSRWGRQIVKRHPAQLSLQDFAEWFNIEVKGEMMAKFSQISLQPAKDIDKKQQQKMGRSTDNKPIVMPTINAVGQPQQSSATKPKSDPKQNDESPAGEKKVLTCLLCKKDHRLSQCPEFAEKSVDDRVKLIKELGCCINCLTKGHLAKECRSRKKCSVDSCNKRHHTLIHGAGKIFFVSTNEATTTNAAAAIPKNFSQRVDEVEFAVILQVVPVIIEANGMKVNSFAFLDPGSEVSLILNNVVDQFNVKLPYESARLGTFHGNDPTFKSRRVDFKVKTIDESKSFPVKRAYSVPHLNVSDRKIDWPAIQHRWDHLAGVDLPVVDTSQVTILLGRDVLRVHDIFDMRIPPDGEEAPDALLTHFGWCLAGPVPEEMLISPPSNPNGSCMSTRRTDVLEQLNDRLSQFWTTESFGVKPKEQRVYSLEEKKAVKILKETIRHTGERYEVGLMLKENRPRLPYNKEPTMRQFLSAERRLKRDPELAKLYSTVINGHISLGHARKVNVNDSNQDFEDWFLPHHGTTSVHKPGKLRVVFNPSAKHRGICLNDQLYKGPDLLTPLIGVLIRFRRFPVPISGDIERMYHQVLVPSPQRSLLKFLWREPGSTEPVDVYQMTVHIFGAVSSPTSCIFALHQTIEEFGHRFPNIADDLAKKVYVDNYLDSTETEEEAVERRRQVTDLLRLGGFNMVQWLSSSRNVLTTVDESDRSRSLDINLGNLPTERTLGLLWDCESDTFTFKHAATIDVTTKRQILSEIGSIYDPLGFLSPVVMVVKVLMQDICRSGCDWDDPLPNTLINIWKSWAQELSTLINLKIPRCIRRSDKPLSFELHTCTDASTTGFGACVYIRAIYGNDDFSVSLCLAKSRVAPLRQLSIPRLELQGALLGARLCTTVQKEMGNVFSRIIFWCDSKTVLQWIHSKTCKYHAFVAHRITEIAESSTANQWRHVIGELNPADDCSRGFSAKFLTTHHRWFRGPDFLQMPDSFWPSLVQFDEPSPDDPEVSPARWIGAIRTEPKPHRLHLITCKYSNLMALKRIVAWYIRFNHNYFLHKQNRPRIGQRWLTAVELRDAMVLLVRVDQDHFFREEILCLHHKKPISTTSKLTTLSPYLDELGVMRVGGRIQHSSLSEDIKHPIILSNDSHLAILVIQEVHIQNGHSSTERSLHALRAQYHVLKPRATVHHFIRHCLPCKKRTAKPELPLMGPLPASRLSSHLPPFTNVGIDFFGPLYVVILRRSVKRYGVMFTCLDYRAVHIEITSSMDLDSFLMAFSRFVDRRTLPKICYSDNGSNLVAGEQELRQSQSKWNSEKLMASMANRDVEWRFSPPAAPHFGGAWESLIKSAKSALRIILNNRSVSDEILSTAMVGVEALLNARPLTHVTINPEELEVLTPNHFIHGRANPTLHVDDADSSPSSFKKRWNHVQEILNHFWHRLLREYTPNLIERRKWLRSRRNLQVNDIVLIITQHAKRGTWPIGRIVRVFPGKDGIVRSAEVQLKRAMPRRSLKASKTDPPLSITTLIRPVHKLCLIECDDQTSVFSGENRGGNVADDSAGVVSPPGQTKLPSTH